MKKNKSLSGTLVKLGTREIKNNWKQLLATTVIGAIAVTLFVGLMANAENFSSRVNKTYENGNMADIWVTSKSYDEKDEANITKIVGDKGQVESRFEMTGQAGFNSIFAVIEKGEPEISKPFDLKRGEKDTNDYFVRIDEALSTSSEEPVSGKYRIGDPFGVTVDMSLFGNNITLLSRVLKLSDYYEADKNPFEKTSMTLDFEVTGIMKYPENICKASFNNSTVIISDKAIHKAFNSILLNNMKTSIPLEERIEEVDLIYNVLSELGLFCDDASYSSDARVFAPNQYLVSLSNKKNASKVKEQIETYFKSKRANNLLSINDRSNMPFVVTVKNDAEQARNFTFLFPFVFFFVAVLVILTTTSQIILKERMQIGTLKAIGLTGNEIMSLYVFITLAVVGLGTLIGEIVGPILVPAIMNQKYSLIYTLPKLGFVFPVFAGVMTAVLFLLAAALVTFYVARKEIKLKPTESMRPRAVNLKSFSMKIEPKHGISFLSFKMALRNMRMNIVKSFMVIAGVLGCTALLVCGFGIEDTITNGLDHDIKYGNAQDISLTFSTSKTKEELESDLASFTGVKEIEMFTKATSQITFPKTEKGSNSSVYILGNAPEKSHFKFVSDLPSDKVAISTKVYEDIGAKAGDSVTFTYSNKTYEAEVYCVYDAFFYNGIIVSGESPILGEWSKAYSGADIDIKEGFNADDICKSFKEMSFVISAQTSGDWKRSINDIMGGILIMTNAVKVFAILLAVTVLYNLALMNFKDRTRDIATMKVLGFKRSEIAFSLLFETMTLTFFGVIGGLFLGIPFLHGVLLLNKVELIYFMISIAPTSFLLAFVLTFIVSFLTNGAFALGSERVKMVESLKSVE